MRILTNISYNDDNEAILNPLVPLAGNLPVLKDGTRIGSGANKFICRLCRYAGEVRVVATRIRQEHLSLSREQVYAIYAREPGRIVHPGYAYFAIDAQSLEHGLLHYGMSKVRSDLDTVLTRLGLSRKSPGVKPPSLFISRSYLHGVAPSDREDVEVSSYAVCTDGEVLTAYDKDGEALNKVRVINASYAAHWAQRVYRDGRKDNVLLSLHRTEKCDETVLAKHLTKDLKLGDLTQLKGHLVKAHEQYQAQQRAKAERKAQSAPPAA